MENKTVFNPSLKKVLKSYQAAATTSLNGPNCYQDIWKGASGVEREKSGTNSELVGSVRRKPIPPPIIIPADRPRCERSETVLEGETISCFIVGGEKRLCLPQILNTVLKDFSLQQINSVCDELQIFCSRCTTEQLEVLKLSGILPPSAPSCGLITKTDAERLCADLLYSTSAPKEKDSLSKDFSFRVYHECFGKCTGTYYPTLYTSATSKCIECTECSGLFAPQKFVCHSHKSKENRTCHWGFDSNNWRAYLLLAKDHKLNMDELQGQLNDMKGRFDYSIHRCSKKRKLTPKKEDGREQPPLVRTTPIYPYLFPPPVWSMDPSLMMYWYRGHLAAKYVEPSAMQKHEKIDPLLVNIHALLVKHNVDKDLRSQIYNEIENIVKQVRSEHGTT